MSVIVLDGRVLVYFLTACNSPAAPTTSELNAGTNLTPYITPDGLNIQMVTGKVPNGNVGSTVTTNLAGRREPTITLTVHHDATSGSTDPAWALLTYRSTGFLAVRLGLDKTIGWASGQGGGGATGALRVYPVQCGEVNDSKIAVNMTWDFDLDLFVNADTMSQRALVP